MGYKTNYYLLILLGVASSCNAFVYETLILKRWNGALGRYQYFVGLSDFHDKSHPANNEQLDQLKKIIQKSSPSSVVVGSEDISSPGMNRSKLCGQFFVQAQGSILGGFVQACRSHGLVCNNFEYRYCRVAALGPILNNLEADIRSCVSAKEITVAALVQEIEAIFSELRSYQDGNVMRDFYELCIAGVKEQMKQLGLYTHQNDSVANYLATTTTPNNRLALLKRLFTFDTVLLDLRMLHSVLAEQIRLAYLAFAGGSHIVRVAQLLSKCGYEWVHNAQSVSTREYNLGKCLGSNIVDGAYCQRPQPIDVRVIERFLQ